MSRYAEAHLIPAGPGDARPTALQVLKDEETALDQVLEPGRAELVEMDNTSLDSVRSAAQVILQKSNNQVNILINNAGIMALSKLEYTKDGLKCSLESITSPIFYSSINEAGNYNFEKSEYNDWVSYGQAKTANIYMANEIERRYGSQGLHATSVHPGTIPTGLMQHIDPAVFEAFKSDESSVKTMKSPEQGTVRGNDNHEVAGVGFIGHAYDG
ncbi:hypothetical protein IFR05_002591 [Cadophora sp. M221]|nr:hypothetical protein IFR05_002591 [Cadophora sp. M221]